MMNDRFGSTAAGQPVAATQSGEGDFSYLPRGIRERLG